jgi:CheY-like chemotaxis protein
VVTLLVVDADVRAYAALERALGARGHTLLAATDSRAALALARAQHPSHALVGPVPRRGALARQLEGAGVGVIALVGPPFEPGMPGVVTFEPPLDVPRVMAWLDGAQPRARSARRARVDSRRVLLVVRAGRALRCPATVSARTVTTMAEAYEALTRPHDLVVVDDELPAARKILAAAAEQGRCAYLLTRAHALDEEALRLGAAGVLAPERIAEVAELPIMRRTGPVAVPLALRDAVLALLAEPMPHQELVARFDRLVLEFRKNQHETAVAAAAAAGMPRTTFMRRVRAEEAGPEHPSRKPKR